MLRPSKRTHPGMTMVYRLLAAALAWQTLHCVSDSRSRAAPMCVVCDERGASLFANHVLLVSTPCHIAPVWST